MDFKRFIQEYNGDFNNKDLILSSFLKAVDTETDLIQQKQLYVLLNHLNFISVIKKALDDLAAKKNQEQFINEIEKICSAFDAASIPAQIYAYFCYCTLIKFYPNFPSEEIKWIDPRTYNLSDNSGISSSATFGRGAFSEKIEDFSINGTELTYVKADREIITIPFGIKTISANAFRGLKKVKYISIPNSVINLPQGAFSGLESLEGVFLSVNMLMISAGAFKNCTHLTNAIGSTITVIGDYAFEGTGIVNLKRIGGEKITSIGSFAFKNCKNLQVVNAPNAMVFPGAFVGCANLALIRVGTAKNILGINSLFSDNGATPALPSLKEISLGFDNGEIPDKFFASFSAEKIILKNEILSIGKSAFEGCDNLQELQAVFKAPIIKGKAFKNCENLKTISQFDNVTTIEESAFDSCKALTSLTINGVVSKIGKAAFANCPSLTTLNINYVGNSLPELCFFGTEHIDITPFLKNVEVLEPHSFTGKLTKQNFNFWDKLKVIKAHAFDQCEIAIEYLTIPAHIRFEKLALQGLKPENLVFENSEIKDEQGNLIPPYSLFAPTLEQFIKDNDSLVGVGVMDGAVPKEFFKGWTNIEKARFSQSISIVPASCFEDCVNLEAVKLDAKTVKFEDRAFYNCKKLVRLFVGDKNVIENGSLKLDSITGLGRDTLYGCASINEIIAESNSLSPLMLSEFKSAKKIRLCLNNAETISFSFYYLFADTLEKFNSDFANLKEVEVVSGGLIPDSFFKGCAHIEIINIQGKVDVIKDSAFMDCVKLKELNLNYSGKDVPACCFMNCQSLEQLTLPNAENVGVSAFENCSALFHLVLSRTIHQLDDRAFKNCVSLESIPFEIAANNVGVEAFMGMSKIKEVTMSNVDRVGEGAFSSCKELTTVSLKNVHKLEPLIFNKCQKIADFNLELAEDYSGDTRFYQLFENDIEEFNKTYKLFSEITIRVNGILPSYFFETISAVKKVNVLGEIKELGDGVFKDCQELEEINLSYTGNSISKEFFFNCKKLTRGLSFTSVDDIGESAFENCQALENISFAPHVKTIGDKAFKNCTSLKQMPFDVCPTSIGAEAFMGCNKFNTLNIVGASFVGDKAFYDIPRFDNISLEQLPNSGVLTTILNADAEIKEVNYFNGFIAPHFFAGMHKLEKVILPEQNVEVSNNAFANCSSLKEIVNLDKVSYLGNECLAGVPIESLTINESAKYVGVGILKGCTAIKEMTIPLLNNTLGSLFSSFAYEGAVQVDHLMKDDGVKTYFIPKSLKSVTINNIKPCPGALSALKNIDITFNCELNELPHSFLRSTNGNILFSYPEKIKVINEYALSETSIGDIDLLNVEEIKDYAFMNSTNIKKATFHQSLRDLSKNAFEGTSLEQLSIINNNHFVCECGFTVSKNTNEIIFVDKDISGDVVVPDMITDIGTLLKGKKDITSIDLNQVTSIADEAFMNCSSLTSLKMPENVTSIGNNILKGVPALDSLIITFVGNDENNPRPIDYLNDSGIKIDNLTVLKGQIAPHFASKKAFKKVDLSKMAYLDLPNNAFVDCAIEELDLPNGTSLSGEKVFNNTDIGVFNSDILHDNNFIYYNGTIYMCYHPDGVKAVTIDENVKGLNEQSFRGVKELEKLEIYSENLPFQKAFMKMRIKEISLVNPQMEKLDQEFQESTKSLIKFTCAATALPANFFKGFTALKELYLDYLENYNLLLSVNKLDVLSLDNLKVIDKSINQVSYNKLSIGDNVEDINYDAFKNIRAKEFVLADNENYYLDNGMYIDRKNRYIFATTKDCQGEIVIPDDIENIYNDAFRNRDITSLDTNNVISIKNGAFVNCSNLETVIISEKTTDIAPGILDKTKVKKLKISTLPENYAGIASFFDGRNVPLEKIVVTDERIYKRNYFAGAAYAKIIIISNDATTIATNAFNGCESLLKLVLPESVEKVEAKAFNGCLAIERNNTNGKTSKKGLTLVVRDLEQVAKFDKNFDLIKSILFIKKLKVNITTEGWEESNYEL